MNPDLHLNNELPHDNEDEDDSTQMDTETDTQPDTESYHDDKAASEGCHDQSDSDAPQSSSPVAMAPTEIKDTPPSPQSSDTTDTNKSIAGLGVYWP